MPSCQPPRAWPCAGQTPGTQFRADLLIFPKPAFLLRSHDSPGARYRTSVTWDRHLDGPCLPLTSHPIRPFSSWMGCQTIAMTSGPTFWLSFSRSDLSELGPHPIPGWARQPSWWSPPAGHPGSTSALTLSCTSNFPHWATHCSGALPSVTRLQMLAASPGPAAASHTCLSRHRHTDTHAASCT